jgi:hypothetical protein
MEIPIEGGKYTLVFDEITGRLSALRYGQSWRDCVGDSLILACMQEIMSTRDAYNKAIEKIEDLELRLRESM